MSSLNQRLPFVAGAAASVLTISALAASPQPDQRPVFSTRRDAVYVDVLVTKDGAPLRGLTAEMFQVRDNDVLQTIDSASTEPVQLDIACVLGRSARLGRDQLPSLSSAGDALTRALSPRDHLRVVPFTGAGHIQEFGAGDQIDFRQWFDGVPDQRGLQPMRDAVFIALAGRHNHPGRFLVLVFGDGYDGRSWSTREQVLDVARRSDAVIYVLKSTAHWDSWWLNTGFFDDLAEATGGRVISAEQEQLSESLSSLLEEYRSRYVLSFQPTSPVSGWHTLQVSLNGASGRVLARRGYWLE